MAGVVLPERPEDQPETVVVAMMRLTGLDEQYTREHLAIMSTADAVNAWERIRAHERAIGRSVSRPGELPFALVQEIREFSGVEVGVIREYLAVRHVMDAIGAWERVGPASAAEARLRRWQVRIAFGRPLPPWAERLIEEIGVEEGERGLARELTAAVMALVGGGEANVREWFAKAHPSVERAPTAVVRSGGWEALRPVLVEAFQRDAGV